MVLGSSHFITPYPEASGWVCIWWYIPSNLRNISKSKCIVLVLSPVLHGIQRRCDTVTPQLLISPERISRNAIVVSVLVNPWLLRSFHKLSHWSCGSAPNANPRNLKIAKSTPTILDHNLSISRPMVFQWFWRLFQWLDSSPYFRQTFCHIPGSARSLERLGGWYWPVQMSECAAWILVCFDRLFTTYLRYLALALFQLYMLLKFSWTTWDYNVVALFSHQHHGAGL